MRFEWLKDGIRADELKWLAASPGLSPVNLSEMVAKIQLAEYKLWRLVPPSVGLAVTYPYKGRLFIYHLHGHSLFGTLHTKDLLEVARHEGLNGMFAECVSLGMKKILKRLGFRVIAGNEAPWLLELHDDGQ